MYSINLLAMILILFVFNGPSLVNAQHLTPIRIQKGEKVTLSAKTANAKSYIWFKDGKTIKAEHNHEIDVLEAAKYTVIAIGEYCNSDLSDPIEIIVESSNKTALIDIKAHILPARSKIWQGEELEYHLTVLNNSSEIAYDIILELTIPKELSYISAKAQSHTQIKLDSSNQRLIWQINELKANTAITQLVQLKALQRGKAVVIANVKSIKKDSVIDNNICRSIIEIVSLFIPNVFTPNGDGKNDTFVIESLELFKTAELRIFNYVGQQVYYSDDYSNDWDGHGLSQGTYFYHLKLEDYNGQTHINKGYITLLRGVH